MMQFFIREGNCPAIGELSHRLVREFAAQAQLVKCHGFVTIFKKITGLTPIDYRNKYNKLAQQTVGAQ